MSTTARTQQILLQHGYLLQDTIGIGGYSKVKSARSGDRKVIIPVQHKLKNQVAIKMISKLKAPQTYLEKFLPREVQALRRLNHPSIVRIELLWLFSFHQTQLYEVIDMPDKVCLVMEYASGGDLLEYINRRGQLSESHSATLFGQLVAAVAHCHGEHVIHRCIHVYSLSLSYSRDLKCENILLTGDGEIKLSGK